MRWFKVTGTKKWYSENVVFKTFCKPLSDFEDSDSSGEECFQT